jgi:hypothetical protein
MNRERRNPPSLADEATYYLCSAVVLLYGVFGINICVTIWVCIVIRHGKRERE